MSNTIYLQHYGILGQKWGVRRFQNPDGTYTSEGKRRRNESTALAVYNPDKNKKKNKNRSSTFDDWFEPKIKGGKDKPPMSKAEKVSKESNIIVSNIDDGLSVFEKLFSQKDIAERNRRIEKMTDDELRNKTNRLNLETNYIAAVSKRETANGKIAASDILKTFGATVSIAGGVVGILTALRTR